MFLGFPGGSDGKESAYSAGDPNLIPGLGWYPGEGNGWLPTQVFLPGEFHGQRNLVSSIGVLFVVIRCFKFSFSQSRMSACWFNDAVRDLGSLIFLPCILSMFCFNLQTHLMVVR